MVRSMDNKTTADSSKPSFKEALTVIITEKRHIDCTRYIRVFRNSVTVKINYISETVIVWNTAAIVGHVC